MPSVGLSVGSQKIAANNGMHKYRATGVDTNGDGQDDTIVRTATTVKTEPERRLKRAPSRKWSEEENDLLRKAVVLHGEKNWKAISEHVPGRNHTQCLQR